MKTAPLAATLLVATSSGPAATSATGRGTMSIGHEGEGRDHLHDAPAVTYTEGPYAGTYAAPGAPHHA